jgi:hypothetical protein
MAQSLTWRAVILVNPSDLCFGGERNLLNKVGVTQELAGDVNDVCFFIAQDLLAGYQRVTHLMFV